MATSEEKFLNDTGDKISEILDELSGIEEWAEDMGYTAIAHKLQEAWGSINSAAAAAYQYADGTLTPR